MEPKRKVQRNKHVTVKASHVRSEAREFSKILSILINAVHRIVLIGYISYLRVIYLLAIDKNTWQNSQCTADHSCSFQERFSWLFLVTCLFYDISSCVFVSLLHPCLF